MLFKENTPIILRYCVSEVQEIVSSVLKICDNQAYTFYLSESLVSRLWKSSNDDIQLRKFANGEKELNVRHQSTVKYNFYCVFGYSKLYDANVYRIVRIEKDKRGDGDTILEYVFQDTGENYILFETD